MPATAGTDVDGSEPAKPGDLGRHVICPVVEMGAGDLVGLEALEEQLERRPGVVVHATRSARRR